MSALRAIGAIAAFDVRSELARPAAIASATVFALASLVVLRIVLAGDSDMGGPIRAGGLWIVVTFAALLTAPRPVSADVDDRCFDVLLLGPTDRSSAILGKMASAWLLTAAVHTLVVAAWATIAGGGATAAETLPILLIVLLADLGIAAAATLISMITVHARSRDALMAAMLLPLVLPAVIVGVLATLAVLGERDGSVGQSVMFLAVYAATITSVAIAAVPEAIVE